MTLFAFRAALLLWGTFSHVAAYSTGTMERAAVLNHQPQSACMVAALHEPLGARLVVHSLTTRRTLVCTVVDTVAARDVALHVRRRIYLELGNRNIWALCGLRYATEEPPRHCSVVYRRIR